MQADYEITHESPADRAKRERAEKAEMNAAVRARIAAMRDS